MSNPHVMAFPAWSYCSDSLRAAGDRVLDKQKLVKKEDSDT